MVCLVRTVTVREVGLNCLADHSDLIKTLLIPRTFTTVNDYSVIDRLLWVRIHFSCIGQILFFCDLGGFTNFCCGRIHCSNLFSSDFRFSSQGKLGLMI